MERRAARSAGLTAPPTGERRRQRRLRHPPLCSLWRCRLARRFRVDTWWRAGGPRRILGCITGMGEHRAGSLNGHRQASFAGIRRLVCAVALAAFGALLWAASPASAAEVVHPSLVQTIDTSRFTPYSSDPSGIVYLPVQDLLLIGDSEVDETGLYKGYN